MINYLKLVNDVLELGHDRPDRTGVGTRSLFGYQTRYNLRNGFPAVTTKKLAWKGVVSELLWFLEGSTDERRLAEIHYGSSRKDLIGKKTIWTANADVQGKELGYINNDLIKELGPVYGSMWRSWGGVGLDQISNVIHTIKNDPFSRRHIVSAWDPSKIQDMTLPPCHTLFQFYVDDDHLSCQLYQRSADVALGVPYNIASYSLLIHIISKICDLLPGDFVHSIGDAHVYHNHIDGLTEQLKRVPNKLPGLKMPDIKTLEDVNRSSVNDYVLSNYYPQSSIKFDMIV